MVVSRTSYLVGRTHRNVIAILRNARWMSSMVFNNQKTPITKVIFFTVFSTKGLMYSCASKKITWIFQLLGCE